jgi:hypothetical protein
MAFPENVAVWMTANKAKILRYAYIPQAVAALVFLLLGYFMGHGHFHLIRDGIRTPGTVVDYKQESFRKSIKRPDVMEERRTVSVSLDAFAPKKISSYVDVLTNAASWATWGF